LKVMRRSSSSTSALSCKHLQWSIESTSTPCSRSVRRNCISNGVLKAYHSSSHGRHRLRMSISNGVLKAWTCVYVVHGAV